MKGDGAGAAGAVGLLLEVHQDPPVGRPGRAFDQVAVGQHALATAIGPHDADPEAAGHDLGEGDIIAARRPDWRGIAAVAEADALLAAAARAHDIELLGATTVGVEHDLGAIVGVGRRGIDRRRGREPARTAAAYAHFIEAGPAAFRQAHRHPRAVRREARRETHAGEIAEKLALAGIDVLQVDLRRSRSLAIGHVDDLL